MASLVLKMSVSLDGFVAPIDGSTDWVAAGRSDDGASWTVETLSNAGAHLMGATTYAGWAAYWPGASGPFAKPMNEIPKVVFSDSLASADWGDTTIAAGDLAEAITRLKQERSDGYLLAHGGARFARSLVETGLIDEYRLVIHPVVLGAGERIFLAPLTIEPMSTTVFSGGAVAHVFAAHPCSSPIGTPGERTLSPRCNYGRACSAHDAHAARSPASRARTTHDRDPHT
ncbi:MAG: dihydrofolate reductase family protein, partial [Solirubrobacteraceae bacterium]